MSKAQENAAFPGYTMDMDTKRVSFQEGISIRDYFAAKAMQGLCANNNTDPFVISKAAYIVADTMLRAREET